MVTSFGFFFPSKSGKIMWRGSVWYTENLPYLTLPNSPKLGDREWNLQEYPLPRFRVSKKHYCCCSVAKSHPTLCGPMDCSMPGFPVLHYLPEFAQTHVHFIQLMMPSNHLILCFPLLLPSVFPSIRVFSEESALRISWPKYRCYRKAIFYCFLLKIALDSNEDD